MVVCIWRGTLQAHSSVCSCLQGHCQPSQRCSWARVNRCGAGASVISNVTRMGAESRASAGGDDAGQGSIGQVERVSSCTALAFARAPDAGTHSSRSSPHPPLPHRYHNKSLLVTFESDNEPQAHAEALTREIQQSFKRLDGEIRGMDKGPSGPQDDPTVRKQVQQQLAQVRAAG